MAVTRKILDDTFSKMMKDTVSEVIEKSIKEGIGSSVDTTLKRVINDSVTRMLQKNMNELLSNNLDTVYKRSFDDLLSQSTDVGKRNLEDISKDFSNDLAKNNPDLLKTMIFNNRGNFGSELKSILQRNINETLPPSKSLGDLRSSFFKTPDGKSKIYNDLNSTSLTPTNKTELELRSIIDDTIKTNKGTKDTLESAYTKMKSFISNNKLLFFKIFGVVALIGAVPLMSLILDQLIEKDNLEINVTKIQKINSNTLKITVTFSNPIKFCPDDKIKVESFNGVTPNIDNTEYNLKIDKKIDDKNYILILESTPNIISVDENNANGKIKLSYGFYDQLGCNLVGGKKPDEDPPDEDTTDEDTPNTIPSEKKSTNNNIIIASISIIAIIILLYLLLKK
jgi:hypothetical protein